MKQNDLTTIRIFLASSAELEKDRDEFDLYFRQQNDHLKKQGIYLEPVRWEHFLDAMSKTRLQDEYNRALRDCDIVVRLFKTKVGKLPELRFAWSGLPQDQVLTNHKCIVNCALMCATGSAVFSIGMKHWQGQWHTTHQSMNGKTLIRLSRSIRNGMSFCTEPLQRGVRMAFVSAFENRDHRLAAATSQQNRFPKCLIVCPI